MEQQAFDQRSADRERWFTDLQTDAQNAQTDINNNNTEISNTNQAMTDYLAVDGNSETDQDYLDYQTTLNEAEGRVDGL